MAAEQDGADRKIQMNVRIPDSLRAAIDDRRKQLGMTRDLWVMHAIELALLQPPGTPVRKTSRRPAVRRAADDRVNGR